MFNQNGSLHYEKSELEKEKPLVTKAKFNGYINLTSSQSCCPASTFKTFI